MKTKLVAVMAATVLCMSFAARSHADPITTLFNTGVDASGIPLPDGTVGDPHYTLVSVPTTADSTTLLVRTSVGGPPIPPWLGDDSLSAWIGPDSDSSCDGSDGDFVYETTFSLAGFNPSTAEITGEWACDNYGVEILLNGGNTGNVGTYPDQFASFDTFNITSGFDPGINTLDFVVHNLSSSGGADTSTGLRVEMTGTAEPLPEPISMIFFGTGLVAVSGYVARRKMQRN